MLAFPAKPSPTSATTADARQPDCGPPGPAVPKGQQVADLRRPPLGLGRQFPLQVLRGDHPGPGGPEQVGYAPSAAVAGALPGGQQPVPMGEPGLRRPYLVPGRIPQGERCPARRGRFGADRHCPHEVLVPGRVCGAIGLPTPEERIGSCFMFIPFCGDGAERYGSHPASHQGSEGALWSCSWRGPVADRAGAVDLQPPASDRLAAVRLSEADRRPVRRCGVAG